MPFVHPCKYCLSMKIFSEITLFAFCWLAQKKWYGLFLSPRNFFVECQDTFNLRGKEYGCEGILVNHTHNQLYSREDCENHCLKENKDNCIGYFYLAYQTSDGTDYYCYNYQTTPITMLLTKKGGYYERNLCYQGDCAIIPGYSFSLNISVKTRRTKTRMRF